jgi:lycopene beta-cyclase
MNSDFDLVIVGGGCAGLSLASRLAELGKDAPKVLIIEARTSYSNDRTWCFWDIAHPEYQSLASHAWSSFELTHQDSSREYNCSQYPYLMLESHHFYQDALAKISANSQLQLSLGEALTSAPIKTAMGWRVETAEHAYTAKFVVDTRPPQSLSDDDAVLWQSFVGYEIQTQSEYFSPKKMVLMDFDSSFENGLAFIYILPRTKNKALVEYTVFAENIIDKAQLIERLEQSIALKLANRSYEILRMEHGALPMGNNATLHHQDPSYLFAGLFAGAARPSSGYAFQRIQSWAKNCAQSILTQDRLYAFPKENWLQSFMDGLFLDVIKKNPRMAASLFEALFSQCDLKTVVKFMSDQASLPEYLRIIRSLPPLPFIKALPSFLIQKITQRIGRHS